MCIRSKLDRQIAHVHSASIPLQPEAHLLLPHTIFRHRIGPQIVPLLTYLVAAFAHWPCLPPERLSFFRSCSLCKPSKEAVNSSSVLDTLQEPGFSSLHQSRRFSLCPIVGHRCNVADMQTARSCDQAQPATTEMPALPDLGRNRFKAAELMQFIQQTAY